jgi:hypothetical protein
VCYVNRETHGVLCAGEIWCVMLIERLMVFCVQVKPSVLC